MGITKEDRELLAWASIYIPKVDRYSDETIQRLIAAGKRALAAYDSLVEQNTCLVRKLRRADHEMDRLLDDYNKLADKKVTRAARQPSKRTCKGCGCDISRKHPNARFHSQACKDGYWNRVNPRGQYAHLNPDHPQYDPVAAYLETVHPFSEEAIQG